MIIINNTNIIWFKIKCHIKKYTLEILLSMFYVRYTFVFMEIPSGFIFYYLSGGISYIH